MHISFLFFWKMSIQICCPFFKNQVVLSSKNSSCMLDTNLLASIFFFFSLFHILNFVKNLLITELGRNRWKSVFTNFAKLDSAALIPGRDVTGYFLRSGLSKSSINIILVCRCYFYCTFKFYILSHIISRVIEHFSLTLGPALFNRWYL